MFLNMVSEQIWYPPWRIFRCVFSRKSLVFSHLFHYYFLVSFLVSFHYRFAIRREFVFVLLFSVESILSSSISLFNFHFPRSIACFVYLFLRDSVRNLVRFCSHNFPQILGFCDSNSISQFPFCFFIRENNSISWLDSISWFNFIRSLMFYFNQFLSSPVRLF